MAGVRTGGALDRPEDRKAELLVERPRLEFERVEKEAALAVPPGEVFGRLHQASAEPATRLPHPKAAAR